MPRKDRLFAVMQILRDGEVHRAADLSQKLNVSLRTIYRDMEQLQASGVPIRGTRGEGYQATGAVALPPLELTRSELEALNLGIAVVAEAADSTLADAARKLADKLDDVLTERVISPAESWKHVLTPFADPARALRHMRVLRSAIKARQKIALSYLRSDGTRSQRTVRPLEIDNWGRVWTLAAWCEWRGDFREFRLDLIETAAALPALFEDAPGRRLSDMRKT